MNQLICLPKCSVSLSGAIFDEDIPFEEWASRGKQIVRTAEAVQWLIGDWINFGWKRYVETAGQDAPRLKRKYKIALESLPYQYQSLANYSWVARSIEFSRRREKLSFRHHAEVAGLAPEEQDRYLAIAEKDGLAVADMRELIRRDKAEVDNESGPAPTPSPNHWANQLSIWLSQQKPPETWPRERLEVTEADLRPIGEYYLRIRGLLGSPGKAGRTLGW